MRPPRAEVGGGWAGAVARDSGEALMPVRFVRGDLFATPSLNAFAHGCNCAGAMGAGIAVEFKRRWPRMYEEYRSRCTTDRFHLGDVFVWDQAGTTVFNLGTQPHWREPAEIAAVRTSVRRMVAEAASRGIPEIGLPRIGAGLGGLRWEDVKRVLVEAAAETDMMLTVFEEHDPGRSAEPL